MSITIISGAKAIDGWSTPEWYGPSTLSFFALDDVGCNGSESNLLDCLPQHNCDTSNDKGTENAGVQCLRKGNIFEICSVLKETKASKKNFFLIIRSHTGVWSNSREQQYTDHSGRYRNK